MDGRGQVKRWYPHQRNVGAHRRTRRVNLNQRVNRNARAIIRSPQQNVPSPRTQRYVRRQNYAARRSLQLQNRMRSPQQNVPTSRTQRYLERQGILNMQHIPEYVRQAAALPKQVVIVIPRLNLTTKGINIIEFAKMDISCVFFLSS